MNNTKQIILLDTDTAQISIFTGKNTRLLSSVLSKTAISGIFEVYSGLGFDDWKHFYNKIENIKFEGLIDEIPEPEESDNVYLSDLTLENGQKVVLCVAGIMESKGMVN